MANAKVVNYTEAQEAIMKAEYTAAPTKETVDMLAAKFGKKPSSIIAKLSRMEIYVPAVRVSKTGDAIVKKDSLAADIAKFIGMTDENMISSLAKANKQALACVLNALKAQAAGGFDSVGIDDEEVTE
jgi:hypothetical protein